MSETGSKDQSVKQSVRSLLTGVIDYAGLFPPTQISMSEAVLKYAAYRNSNFSWLLGRFVLPAALLDDFYENAANFASKGAEPWHLAVVAGEDIYETIKVVSEFNRKNAPDIECDVIEARASSVSKIENTTREMPEGITTYFELALDASLPDLVSELALRKQRAKIRTGGVTADAFPTSGAIIRFVRTCLAANVPFKATAGLHHPVRCFKPLTYEANAPFGTMHGFLNLFIMTAFAREGFKPSVLQDVMEDEFEEVFKFEENSIRWRDEHAVHVPQIERVRQTGINSFGSCSFDEPIADLQAIGVL